MPFVLLALIGLGVYVATKRGVGPGSPGVPPAMFVTRDASGTLVATKDGFTIALTRLLRYGPAARIVGGAPILTGSEDLATAAKRYLGMIGNGQPPVKVAETAVGWVEDRMLEGKYVLLRADLFGANGNPNQLPTSTTILAVDPTDPPNVQAQLGSLMVPQAGWVLLGDPTELASRVTGWPDNVADFLALG